MLALVAEATASPVVEVILAALNVIQTIALAYLAAKARQNP